MIWGVLLCCGRSCFSSLKTDLHSRKQRYNNQATPEIIKGKCADDAIDFPNILSGHISAESCPFRLEFLEHFMSMSNKCARKPSGLSQVNDDWAITLSPSELRHTHAAPAHREQVTHCARPRAQAHTERTKTHVEVLTCWTELHADQGQLCLSRPTLQHQPRTLCWLSEIALLGVHFSRFSSFLSNLRFIFVFCETKITSRFLSVS